MRADVECDLLVSGKTLIHEDRHRVDLPKRRHSADGAPPRSGRAVSTAPRPRSGDSPHAFTWTLDLLVGCVTLQFE
jgi:hypothetical protein